MTPAEFLRYLWPDKGPYCIAVPFKIPGTENWTYAHHNTNGLAGAVAYVEENLLHKDMFFAVHSLKVKEQWNPKKLNHKTGELGAFEKRTHDMMAMSRAYFFDLDVGRGEAKYPDQFAAGQGLINFCKSTGLPGPLVTSSGGGLHVYWRLDDAIPSDVWVVHAEKLKQLAVHFGLRMDPSRTTDVSSVLRVAGTFNMKDPNNPREVKVLKRGASIPNNLFTSLVDDAYIKAGITPQSGKKKHKATAPLSPEAAAAAAILGNNTEKDFGPPVPLRAVVDVCSQMERLVRLQGNVSEPEWFASLQLVRHLKNGDKLAHKISEAYPRYDPSEVEKKLDHLKSKGVGPTSCAKFINVCGPEACNGCQFRARDANPIIFARDTLKAPQPKVEPPPGIEIPIKTIPDAPKPFTRRADGRIGYAFTNNDGDTSNLIILDHDLYPLRRLSNQQMETEQQMWRAVTKNEGEKDFTLDADALYDRRKFITAIANRGIYVQHANIQHLQDYMIAYISELQRLERAEDQCNHLGWNKEHTEFTLPDKILGQNGAARPVSLSVNASRASEFISKKGSLERQLQLMHFYNKPAYLPHQFFLIGGLAAPLFYATGHHGAIINATGEPGASKSTALYTAAALWGDPELFTINGTNDGSTIRARNELVSIMSNLPLCVDEITLLPQKDAANMAMSITQAKGRGRLEQNGTLRKSIGSQKSTLMLTTANKSLHSLLSEDNSAGTAGSMRVVEIEFKKVFANTKAEADDYVHDLNQNFGHIGELFLAHFLKDQHNICMRVREKIRKIDIVCRIEGGERFWSATIATIVVACEVAFEAGLLPYDSVAIENWAVNKLMPSMRGVVVDEYASPLGTLSDFLEHINGDMLVFGKPYGNSSMPNVLRQPRGQLLAHYDMGEKVMYVLAKAFRDYCTRQGSNSSKILDVLSTPTADDQGRLLRIISNKHLRRTLGAGTEHAKSQSWVFAINMDHPDVAPMYDEAKMHLASSNPGLAPIPGTRPNLKVVS